MAAPGFFVSSTTVTIGPADALGADRQLHQVQDAINGTKNKDFGNVIFIWLGYFSRSPSFVQVIFRFNGLSKLV
jgi:hypothetical protein